MICYSPKPQDEYVIKMKTQKPDFLKHKFSMGLGDLDFVPYPALWNYLVVTSRLPFMWEDGTDKAKLPTQFTHQDIAQFDMSTVVGGRSITDLVSTESPVDFLEWMQKYSLVHLKMAKFHGGADNLMMVIRARVYAWKTNRTKEEEAILRMVGRDVSS